MKIVFKKRSDKKELLDLKTYTLSEYQDCLDKLGKIGKRLGCQEAMLEQIFQIFNQSDTVPTLLDVGCGGGDFTALIAKTFPYAAIVGLDNDDEAIKYAKKKWREIPNLSFSCKDMFENAEKKYDVVTSTLVCHHLTDSELRCFFQKAGRLANKALVINDLHRHPLAYCLFFLTSPILFRNRLIQSDGLLSIKRAFTSEDWENLLSDFPKKKIEWHWPFRWIVRVDL